MEDSIVTFLNSGVGLFTLFALIAWSAVWKGLALWRSAKKDDTFWFVIFLIFNTVGLLEILYYFVLSKDKKSK
ncbi:hypothetical protein K0A96_02265 [Patescibacteria group bacterium]|nr:hypothetical protein [Patescibacteria group bacterium]